MWFDSFHRPTDILQEIRRLGSVFTPNVADFEHDSPTQQERCETLLKEWTKAVAASRGLSVQNFTTSFSDGQIFKAILDEYEHFLVEGRSAAIVPLHQRLRTLGCNAQFSNPFGTKHGRSQIFGKDFVLAVLTFLCSRLLAPSKVCRKAVVMQKSWRRYWQATLS